MREPQRQTWPELVKAALAAPLAAAKMSTSSRIIVAFLPPSSNDNFLNIGAAVAATDLPVTVPPVNDIALILDVQLSLADLSAISLANQHHAAREVNRLEDFTQQIGSWWSHFVACDCITCGGGAIFQVSK